MAQRILLRMFHNQGWTPEGLQKLFLRLIASSATIIHEHFILRHLIVSVHCSSRSSGCTADAQYDDKL